MSLKLTIYSPSRGLEILLTANGAESKIDNLTHSLHSLHHAIIPAAGFGTRFLPWAKAVPKEMIPLGSKPVLHYVVEEAAEAGLSDIILVISKGKESICRYFEEDPELETFLRSQNKHDLLAELNALRERIQISYVYQDEMRGLGDAVLCGLKNIPGKAFAVLLGDTVIRGSSPLPAMSEAYRKSGVSQVAVQPVPPHRAVRYGVCGGKEVVKGQFHLDEMVEKPAVDEIPLVQRLDERNESLAFAARYVFSPAIGAVLESTPPGRNGEIQLTDAMRTLLHKEGFRAFLLEGQRLDIGNPEGLREALLIPGLL